MSPLLKIVLEIGPLAAFFIAYNRLADSMGDLDGLIWATGAFMAALLISMAITYALTRTLSRMALVTSVIVLTMGALTIWLHDDVFIKMKPTIVNVFFAFALGFGLLRGQSYLKYLMGEFMPLTDEGWMKLTRNWALFFVAMAVLNELIWRTQTTEMWVDLKTFAYLPLTLAFTISQAPLMSRHTPSEEDAAAAEDEQPRDQAV